MDNTFTEDYWDDTLDIKYESWEDIPVSTLNFTNSNTQVCYIALRKDDAVGVYNTKAVPPKAVAYEHMENVKLKAGEVILTIEVDTTNMLDLTNKSDYIQYLNCRLNDGKLDPKISLIRKVLLDKELNHFQVAYIIKDNRCVKNISK